MAIAQKSTKVRRASRQQNCTAWRLAIRGIEGKIEHGGSSRNDRHPTLKADYVPPKPTLLNVRERHSELLHATAGQYGLPRRAMSTSGKE